jgi:uncharacterized protein YjbI with pentapeptide repeats
LRVTPDRELLDGTPELWCIVLDQMAADVGIRQVGVAIERFLEIQCPDLPRQQMIRTACLASFARLGPVQANDPESLAQQGIPPEALGAIRHDTVRTLLAARQVARDLAGGAPCAYLSSPLPFLLIRRTAAAIAGDGAALEHLREFLHGRFHWQQPMALSILYAADLGWKPDPGRIPLLSGGYFPEAQWPGICLAGADLRSVDFDGAILEKAILDKAVAGMAHFNRANLGGASLQELHATEAQFEGSDLSSVSAEKAVFVAASFECASLDGAELTAADFRGANLTGASFQRADLGRARLTSARILEADFSGANLEQAELSGLKLFEANFTGARFVAAVLRKCDLEEMALPEAHFEGADLRGALLTGCLLRNANLSKADLRETGLADINAEGADLRGADLRGATFHMGSSRSGLVFSFIASEGSRTGFYTDDYEEQIFKAPEEIRKANLCGADLRGARVDDVDFYLVDLRGARYDPEQVSHFRRCRAILEDRV